MKTKIILAASALGLGAAIYFFKLNEIAAMTIAADDSNGTLLNYPRANSETSIAAAFNEAVVEYASAEEIFKAYREKPQEFIILNDADATITGKDGTQIHFPAGVLQHQDGSEVNGEIKITLIECYDLANMVTNELSTKSNEALLETAGMVKIEAFQNGKKLKIANNTSYSVAFPKSSEREDFKLFYGQRQDNGGINWILAEQPEQNDKDTKSRENVQSAPVTEIAEENCFIQINKSYFRRNGKIALMDFYTWKTADGQLFNNWFVSSFNPPVEMVNAFCDLNYQSEVMIKFDKNGYVKERLLSKRSTPEWDLEILKLVDDFPQMDLSQWMEKYDEDHGVILQFGKKIGSSQDNMLVNFERKYAKGDTIDVADIDKANIDYYIFGSSQLGWLNCDRFYENEERVDFYVDMPNAKYTTVSLAFSDYQGLLAGNYSDGRVVFRNIPKDKKATLVAVECVASQPIMDVRKVNTSTGRVELNNFKAFKLKELKMALNTY